MCHICGKPKGSLLSENLNNRHALTLASLRCSRLKNKGAADEGLRESLFYLSLIKVYLKFRRLKHSCGSIFVRQDFAAWLPHCSHLSCHP